MHVRVDVPIEVGRKMTVCFASLVWALGADLINGVLCKMLDYVFKLDKVKLAELGGRMV